MSSDKQTYNEPFTLEGEEIEAPAGVDRRTFLMRSAMIGSMAVIAGLPVRDARTAETPAAPKPQMANSPNQSVVEQSKGPVMTTQLPHHRPDAHHL